MYLNLKNIPLVMMSMFLICSCGEELVVDSISVGDQVPEELFTMSHVLSGGQALIPTGATSATKEKRSIVDAAVNVVIRDQKMSGITTRIFEREYVSDYISNDSVKTEFKKDLTSGRAMINGQPTPQPHGVGPMHQQTIVFTRSEKQWVGALVDSEASPGQILRIEELTRLIDGYNNRAILGTIPRKIGESWRVKPSKLNSYAGGLEEMDGHFEVSFRSIVIHDGYICAEILANFDLIGSEPKGKEMRIAGKVKMLQSLDHQIPLMMKMIGEIDMVNPIMNGMGKMSTKGPIELTRDTILALP
jgi:hypothetical protein